MKKLKLIVFTAIFAVGVFVTIKLVGSEPGGPLGCMTCYRWESLGGEMYAQHSIGDCYAGNWLCGPIQECASGSNFCSHYYCYSMTGCNVHTY
jgi:hypothetical protein